MTDRPTTSWVVRLSASETPLARVFCLPAVGGGVASFHPWRAHLPEHIELCVFRLPGRETRLLEPTLDVLDDLVGSLADELSSWLDLPYAIVGDCSGAVVMLELGRLLRRRSERLPLVLFGAACPAPQLPQRGTRLHELPLERMIDQVAEFGGLNDLLLEDPELLELLEPMLRADLRLAETWTYRDEQALDVPISMLGGLDDRLVAPEDLLAWQAQTSRSLTLRLLPGGHFVLTEQPALATRSVAADIDQLLGLESGEGNVPAGRLEP